jgi:uncharacterized membrane protein YdjX (TVP38/TMEM64 family)
MPAGRWRRIRYRTFFWAALSLVFLALAYPGLRRVTEEAPSIHIEAVRARVAAWGPWGPVASLLLMTAHPFLPSPGELVVAMNGAVFGFWEGLAISWCGAMSSACLAFAIGRSLVHARKARSIPQKLLRWADAIVKRGDWPAALVIRFIPLFPFGVFNFALGRTALSWPVFLWTTGVGVFPVNAAVVAIGYGAAEAPEVLLSALAALFGLTMIGLVFRYRIAGRKAR